MAVINNVTSIIHYKKKTVTLSSCEGTSYFYLQKKIMN